MTRAAGPRGTDGAKGESDTVPGLSKARQVPGESAVPAMRYSILYIGEL